MIRKFNITSVNIILIIFFLNALIEVVAEQFSLINIIYIAKPLIPILLIILYWISSSVKNPLFFITLLLSVITNLLFIPNNERFLFYAIIIFTIHRIIMLFYIFKLQKVHYTSFIITTIPLFLIFFYLFVESSYVPENTYFILIFQVFMISIFGGIALSSYIVDDNRQNSYLMICGLLFMGLQLVVFVEKIFLHEISIHSFRPLAMILNALAFYTFYKFVIEAEESKQLSISL
jgi:hypothetical protein